MHAVRYRKVNIGAVSRATCFELICLLFRSKLTCADNKFLNLLNMRFFKIFLLRDEFLSFDLEMAPGRLRVQIVWDSVRSYKETSATRNLSFIFHISVD